MDTAKITAVEVEGIEMSDFPHLSNAFISYAEWDNGTPLSEEELDSLNDDCRPFVWECAYEAARP